MNTERTHPCPVSQAASPFSYFRQPLWSLFTDSFCLFLLLLMLPHISCCSPVSQGESVDGCLAWSLGCLGPSLHCPAHSFSQLVNGLLFLAFYFGKCLNISKSRGTRIMSPYRPNFNNCQFMATPASSITPYVFSFPQHWIIRTKN